MPASSDENARRDQSTITPGTPGRIYTFYSFKGGVGRSMALANTAALLARWGQRVLVIDWDLEAPGIEKYFEAWLSESRKTTPGLIELINTFAEQAPLNWRDCLLHARIPQGQTIAVLHAGRDSDDYTLQLRKINWERLFANQKFGLFLERLRTEWITEYDFVFVDSRTGFTDIGGICTIHLPDVLIGLFTASDQSLIGIKDVFKRAVHAHSRLPVDRHRLQIVPVPARDESNTEYALSGQWRQKFASELEEFYNGWLPKDETVERILDHLKIPYFAYWSFGERLPVLEEDPNNPKKLAFSYQLIARLLLGNLDWEEVKRGTRAVEAEGAQKLAMGELELKVAQVREVAERRAAERERTARQDQLEELRRRRENFLEELWKPALKRHRRRRILSLIGVWVSGFYLCVLLFSVPIAFWEIYSNPERNADLVSSVPGLVILGVLTVWGFYASWKGRRRNRWVVDQLQSELAQYEGGVGKYSGLTPESALAEFVNTVQTILILKQPSPVSQRPLVHTSTQQSNQAELPISVQRKDVPVDVFLSYEHSAFSSAWLREFVPLFSSWLKEDIGREPHVFDPERLLQFQEIPPQTLQALNNAHCFVPILTPSYFRSEFCLAQLRKFIELQGDQSGHIIPLYLHPLEPAIIPPEFNIVRIQWANFTDFAFIGEAFTKTERYIDFQKALRMFSSDVAKVIASPSLNPREHGYRQRPKRAGLSQIESTPEV